MDRRMVMTTKERKKEREQTKDDIRRKTTIFDALRAKWVSIKVPIKPCQACVKMSPHYNSIRKQMRARLHRDYLLQATLAEHPEPYPSQRKAQGGKDGGRGRGADKAIHSVRGDISFAQYFLNSISPARPPPAAAAAYRHSISFPRMRADADAICC